MEVKFDKLVNSSQYSTGMGMENVNVTTTSVRFIVNSTSLDEEMDDTTNSNQAVNITSKVIRTPSMNNDTSINQTESQFNVMEETTNSEETLKITFKDIPGPSVSYSTAISKTE